MIKKVFIVQTNWGCNLGKQDKEGQRPGLDVTSGLSHTAGSGGLVPPEAMAQVCLAFAPDSHWGKTNGVGWWGVCVNPRHPCSPGMSKED